jgi:hypothetical protein
MKNLSLTFCLVITLFFCNPAFSGVGDVYYCVSDKFIVYDENKNDVKFDNKNYKFKFKWSEDMVEFGEGFVFSGHLYMDKNNDLSFSDTSFQASFRQNFAYFDEPELSYTDFFYNMPRRMVFATCDKF